MEKTFTRETFIRVLILALFIFALVSNVNVIVTNHAKGKILADKKTETAKGEYNIQKLKLLIAYYQSPSYQEVEARRRLQLKKPGETVYIVKGLTSIEDNSQPSTLSEGLYKDIQPALPAPITNFQQWWNYLFN